MAKTVILSNGNLNIGLNEFGLVSDFYFPDNGYENHTLGRDLFHRVGVKIGNKFSWLHSGDWQFSTEYLDNALISKTTAKNYILQIQIEFTDFVVSDFDVFARKIKVKILLITRVKFSFFYIKILQLTVVFIWPIRFSFYLSKMAKRRFCIIAASELL